MHDGKPSPELYFETMFAYQRSAALNVAIELDLFTTIEKGTRNADAIANATGVPQRSARILCDYLTTLGFLKKSADAYDVTPDTAAFLSKRSPMYLGSTAEFLYNEELRNQFAALSQTIRTQTPPTNVLAADHAAWVGFARAMVPMMMPSAQAIADLIDANAGRPMRVLDIAAGHGIFGIVVAKRNPQAQIVALDWAPVLEVATENAKNMGVADRHETLPGDALKIDYGTGFDVALVTNFVHHFDHATSVAFFKKVAGALKSGGRVVLLEFVPNADRLSPPMAARFALVMLATTPGGDAYTFDELRSMLQEAGFRNAAAHALQGPQAVVIAEK